MDRHAARLRGLGAHLRDAAAARPTALDFLAKPSKGVTDYARLQTQNTSGKIVWCYQFAGPGSTRQNEIVISESGFATKQEATAAEAVRRTEEQKKYEMAKAGAAGVAAAMPTTLAMLLAEFMKQHAEENLAPKTVERYREMAAYLAPELLAMNMTEITPLHLSREWTRLLKCGGHTRKTKTPRADEAEDGQEHRRFGVLCISARDQVGAGHHQPRHPQRPPQGEEAHRNGAAAIRAGPPDRVRGRTMVPPDVSGDGGRDRSRRGEVLALRWSDIRDGAAFIDRSLCQTRDGLMFKSTKTEEPRRVELPPTMLAFSRAIVNARMSSAGSSARTTAAIWT